MVISFTSSKVTPEQGREVEEFLSGFLPRLKAEQSGVVAIYHFTKAQEGEEVKHPRRLALATWHQMPVAVKRDRDARVAHICRERLGVHPRSDHECGVVSRALHTAP